MAEDADQPPAPALLPGGTGHGRKRGDREVGFLTSVGFSGTLVGRLVCPSPFHGWIWYSGARDLLHPLTHGAAAVPVIGPLLDGLAGAILLGVATSISRVNRPRGGRNAN